MKNGTQVWDRFQKYHYTFPAAGLAMDLSRMNFTDKTLASLEGPFAKAFSEMAELEKGAIANPDEKRMVGHYWLRNPALAPKPEIRTEIENTLKQIKEFAAKVHKGEVKGAKGTFKNLLLIGIGGSALGPQFVANALSTAKDRLRLFTFDNTDPDGIDRVLAQIGDGLGQTLSVVISKSGGTKETRNGMLEARAAYEKAGLNFGQHTVAVTSNGSELDKYATGNKWLAKFPMWDWVGGRTSELSAVGLLPAALQGFDIDGLLAGAKACDEVTRKPSLYENPAALLTAMWYYSGDGKGDKNMIILPYKDRLELLSKYLQQLIMESVGKELDRSGKRVNQGITVLGNKGATDQHSYIQQLREGLSNFFVIFVRVLRDRQNSSMQVEPGVTSGDYLEGFYQGTRRALHENGRESLTITVEEVNASTVGALIALFERSVGLYASLINVNAYHQPGVEAGKKAASAVIALQLKVAEFLKTKSGQALSAADIADQLDMKPETEAIYLICEHLAANDDRNIAQIAGKNPGETRFKA